jgi:hypothetical protein
MSIIFPTEPALISVQNLPTKAEFISYRIQEGYLKIKAWMKDGMGTLEYEDNESDVNNAFFADNCEDCERCRYSYYSEHYYDEDIDEVDNDAAIAAGECMVYFDGYDGQPCPKGYKIPDNSENDKIVLNNLVFEGIFFLTQKQFSSGRDQEGWRICGTVERFKPFNFNVHVCKGVLDEEDNILHTYKRPCANVHCDRDTPSVGNVCWGDNDYPNNIREAVSVFTSSEFNSDIINVNTFIEGLGDVDCAKPQNKSKEDKFLCSGYDALMMLDGERDRQAFYTMLMAGYKSLPEAPHIMLIPLEQATIQRGDNFYFGYLTKPDSVGRQWYVSSENYLIGQMDDSFVKTV